MPAKKSDVSFAQSDGFGESLRPFEVELGCGFGALLFELASWHPTRRYVGVEIKPDRAREAKRKVLEQGITNVEIVEGEAEAYLRTLSEGAVDVLHVYHPTPFPSSLGLPHRLLTSSFEAEAYRVLKVWGRLRLVTDHRSYYFAAIREYSPVRWWAVDWHRDAPALLRGALVGSPVEMEYRAAGVTEFFASELMRIPQITRNGLTPRWS